MSDFTDMAERLKAECARRHPSGACEDTPTVITKCYRCEAAAMLRKAAELEAANQRLHADHRTQVNKICADANLIEELEADSHRVKMDRSKLQIENKRLKATLQRIKTKLEALRDELGGKE